MTTDDELRGYYADLAADPAAEQRLRAVISGVGQHSRTGESGTRRWLAVAATAAVVVAGTLSAFQLRASHPTSAVGPSATASSATASSATASSGPSGTVPLTPRIAARILIDLLPKGERFGPVRGSATPGRVTVSVIRLGPAEYGVVTVVVCHATATRTVADNCPKVADREGTTPFPANGRKVDVGIPSLRVPVGASSGWEIALLRRDGVAITVVDAPDHAGRLTTAPNAKDTLLAVATSARWQVRVPKSVDAEARAHPLPDATFGSQPDPAEPSPGQTERRTEAPSVLPLRTTSPPPSTVGPPSGTEHDPAGDPTPTSTR